MKKLRSKMIRIVLFSVIIAFFLMAAVLYVALNAHNVRQADLMTQIISENNGVVPVLREGQSDRDSYPVGFNEESPYSTRYFIVYINQSGEVAYTNTDNIAAIDEEDATEMAEEVLSSGKKVGFQGKYRFRVSFLSGAVVNIVFLDYSENQSTQQVFLLIMSIVFVAFALMISVVFIICSKFVLKPFEENSQRQKQFITDASHELKTPLAIISANAEVLEYKNGKNEWTQTIRAEAKHMGELIGDLLVLSKLQEKENVLQMEAVDFSQTVLEVTEKFREVIAQKQCTIETRVQPDVRLNGDKAQLVQLVSILIENASKYVTEQGKIEVALSVSGRTAALRVFNTAKIDANLNCGKLFERFYRADSSHSSSTGGHGIGLSIAKRIADGHHGTITACKKEDGILFSVSLPCNLKGKQVEK